MNLTKTITIPAASGGGPGVVVEPVSRVRQIFCLSSTADFSVRTDTGSNVTLGTGRSLQSEMLISQITFYNPTATAITVTFFAGEDYTSQVSTSAGNVLTVTNEDGIVLADPTTQGSPQGAALSSFDHTYLGTHTFNGIPRLRKFIEITNSSDGNDDEIDVYIGTSRIARVQPNSVRRFDLCEDIRLVKTGAGNIRVSVYEVF